MSSRQSQISEPEKHAIVRRILLGRSTPLDEANKFHIGVRSIEDLLNDGRLRNGIKITAKSTWHPKPYSLEFKKRCAERVKAGESPAVIAKETPGLLPGTIRNWSLGIDMEEVDTQPVHSARNGSSTPRAPQSRPPEPAPAEPTRHPKRDEAVKAFRAGMPIADIILALELNVSADAIRDWDAEDRAAAKVAARYTEEQKTAAVDRILGGEAPQKVADELGCTTKLLQMWATARMQARKQNAVNGDRAPDDPYRRNAVGPRSAFTAEQQIDACQRVARGYDIDDVAEEMGVHRTTLRDWSRKHNIDITRRAKNTSATDSHRVRAVQRVIDGGEKAVSVANDIGVSESTLSGWVVIERERRRAQAEPVRNQVPVRADNGQGLSGSVSRFTEEQQIAAVNRWVNGEDREKICKELGVVSSLLVHWADKHGITPPIQRRFREDNPIRIRAVQRVLDEGVSMEVIAEELGIEVQTVRTWVRPVREARAKAELEELKRLRDQQKQRVEGPVVAAAPPEPEPKPALDQVVNAVKELAPAAANIYYRVDTVPLPPPPPVVPPAPVAPAPPAPQPQFSVRYDGEPVPSAPVRYGPPLSAPPAPPVMQFQRPYGEQPVAPSPRKAKAMQILLCPSCDGQVIVPTSANPQALIVTQGTCPHCRELVEL